MRHEDLMLMRTSAALREYWDPIGRGQMPDLPDDEYEAYAPGVLQLLAAGADDDALAEHLRGLETRSMGLGPSSPHRLLRTVRQIREALINH
jgi:hypothetical protein